MKTERSGGLLVPADKASPVTNVDNQSSVLRGPVRSKPGRTGLNVAPVRGFGKLLLLRFVLTNCMVIHDITIRPSVYRKTRVKALHRPRAARRLTKSLHACLHFVFTIVSSVYIVITRPFHIQPLRLAVIVFTIVSSVYIVITRPFHIQPLRLAVITPPPPPPPSHRCEKCLQNRYGISKGKVGAQWKCPFCSGQCNCSVCRKKVSDLTHLVYGGKCWVYGSLFFLLFPPPGGQTCHRHIVSPGEECGVQQCLGVLGQGQG